ncbi:MAG: hypothetical protein NZM39_12310 [Bernardetiaceae bacterium]|nr:hypothetical protein [Bernardetiaceae bacterium]
MPCDPGRIAKQLLFRRNPRPHRREKLLDERCPAKLYRQWLG